MGRAKLKKIKKQKPTGLDSWLPTKGSPHLYTYSNLLRNGYTKKQAYRAIKKQLIQSGVAIEEDFKLYEQKIEKS